MVRPARAATSRDGLRRAAVAGVIGGSAGFLLIAWLVTNGMTDDIDRTVMLAMRDGADPDQAWGPVWLRESAAEWTALGGYPILVILVGALVIGFLAAGRRRTALLALASLLAGAALSSGLKLFFSRPRPDLVEHLDRIFTSSFPSAHAMVGTITFLTIAAMLGTVLISRSLRLYIFAVAALIAILVGVSRVYLGVHWPSDVLAGWAAGIAWSGLAWLLADRFISAPRPSPPPA